MTRIARWTAPLALGTVLAATHPAAAQDALVLSGGGARGLAHAGALVGLEELERDPEIVVGTSMGALVGALYAAGYAPEEIWRIVESQHWEKTFSPPPLLVGPRRAPRYPVLWAGFGVAPLRFSPGFVPDWRINHFLGSLLLDANLRIRGDFDRLPRRYRAVAADLRSGEMVVLGSGDLARAARASMAVPGFFSPVAWDDRILVDGGIANNLPVSVAREMGAGHVVAIEADPLSPEVEDLAPPEVVSRTVGLLLRKAQGDQPRPDVLVALDPGSGLSAAAFPADATPLLREGRSAVLEALQPAHGDGREAGRELPPPPTSFGDLWVAAPDAALEALVRREFEEALRGGYDPERLRRALDRLYATGFFSGLWPHAVEAGGEPVLAVRAETPPRTLLSGAAGYGNDRGARVWGTVQQNASLAGRPLLLSADLSWDGLEGWGSVWARIYPPGRAPLAASAGAYYRQNQVRIFDHLDDDELEVHRTGGWLGLERRRVSPERTAAVLAHLEWVEVEGGESGLSFGPLLRIAEPRHGPGPVGVETFLEAELRLGEVEYRRAALRGDVRRELGSLLLAGVADLTLASDDTPPDLLPALGDEHLVPGFRWGEERGQARAVVGLDLAYPWLLGGYARALLRAGAAPDDLDGWTDEGVWVGGVEAGAFWQTPLGALDVGVGVNTDGEARFGVQLAAYF